MKVIVAGMPKTGTKSMNEALTKLGYNVYDFAENIFLMNGAYNKIVKEGWTTEDFRQMYENVDAVVDYPAYFFWDEILRAFPDSKVILTIRDNEEQWLRSFRKQIEATQGKMMATLMMYLSPTYRKGLEFSESLGTMAFGIVPQSPLKKTKINDSMTKKMYRAHNAYVQQAVPKDQLLVYKCSDGWEPLCKFLGAPDPEEPFPRTNVGASIVDDAMEKYPVFKKMRNEVITSSIVIAATACAIAFAVQIYGFSGIFNGFCSAASRVGQFFNII